MAVDIRATVTCSLGTLISGNISDDYLQGNGLIKSRGSLEIQGIITPAIGTAVSISYTKGGVTRTIPRKLRVLSSFADPYRRTTKVELGCKLTYLSDLKEPVNWDVFDEPTNAAYTEADASKIVLPILAASVMEQCLTKLGLVTSSNPLINRYSIGEFDFSAGYVQVLSDLLVSESFCGYLDADENLQIVNLTAEVGTGNVYTSNDIIDISSINSGQLPGESVTVSYNSLQLRRDAVDDSEQVNWETNTVVAGPNTYYIGDRSYTGMETTTTTVAYDTINGKNVPITRTTVETGSTAKVAGSIGTSYVKNGLPFNAIITVLRREVENSFYDENGDVIRSEVTVFENDIAFFGSLSMEYAFEPDPNGNGGSGYVSFPTGGARIAREKTVTTYTRIADVQQEISTNYKAWVLTIPGQQAVAENRDSFTNAADAQNFVRRAIEAGLVLDRSVTSINQRSTSGGKPKAVMLSSLSKAAPPLNPTTAYSAGTSPARPENNWRTTGEAQLELALGSATAQRRTEFSMTYAPDDYFAGPPGGPYTIVRSNAAAVATRFGRVQNRLLLGNRNGMNIQLAPERLPAAPFAPMYVQANGLTAQYRANGNQWAFTSDGIACSTDALFWSAVGGTGTFWFPVAPGVTTLPSTPPIVGGQMTPTRTIRPYNESSIYDSVVRLRADVVRFPYSLSETTIVIPVLAVKLVCEITSNP